jgi:hypothetical protein
MDWSGELKGDKQKSKFNLHIIGLQPDLAAYNHVLYLMKM